MHTHTHRHTCINVQFYIFHISLFSQKKVLFNLENNKKKLTVTEKKSKVLFHSIQYQIHNVDKALLVW